jgi:preprotein translocase subunit SecD
LIGLILVVIYSLFQYRALAIVTIGSLLIAAVITYVVITFLSWRQGFRLSLSGVAGLIVAIGITADSFIVYFERVRDELRDGRPLNAAVESGWKRAFRTILVSDGVNILAAVVLFLLTVGSVQGFAYTIGLTTLIDVAVVMLFTHPMLQLLSQTKFFASGHPWSGFDARSLGASYRGRLEFKTAERVSGTKKAKASKEATKRQTLAERKAAQAEEGN